MARALADAGADVEVGTHAHVQQGAGFRSASEGERRPSRSPGRRVAEDRGFELAGLARRPHTPIPRFALKLSVKCASEQQTTSLGYADLHGR